MIKKYKSLGKNTLVFAISSFGTKILSFLLVPLYTNMLTTEEYGVADLITTTATLMVFIFTINIAEAVLRFALEYKEKTEEILSYGIKILCIGTLVLTCSIIIVWRTGLVNWKNPYYIFMLVYFFFTAFYQILTNYMRAIDKVKAVAVSGVISSGAMICANIIFLLIIKIGIWGYLTGLILGPLAGSLYAIYKIHLPLKKYFVQTCSFITRKEMKIYCIPLVFNNIALWINSFIDRYFIIDMCGVKQNGVYAVASKIPAILSMFYAVFSQAWTLSAVKEFDKEDKDGFFSNTYRMYNSLIVCTCSGIILLNVPLAKFLYAKDFFTAWQYSSVLLISVMFNALTAFLGSLFSAVKDSRVIAVTTLVSAIVNVVLNILLIPLIGALGAAVATVVCYAVMWIVRYVVIKKYINIRVSLLRDIVTYVLLVIQVVFEHIEGHCYIGQIIIFITILVLYWESIIKIISKILELICVKVKI